MKNTKLTSIVLGTAIIASFALVSAALAEESTSTATTTVATTTEVVVVATTTTPAAVTATATRGWFGGFFKDQKEAQKNLMEKQKEDLKNLRDKQKEDAKNLREQNKEDRKDFRASTTASTTAMREQRKADMLKKQMDSATQAILNLSTKLGTLGTQIKAIVNGQASSTDAVTQAVSKEDGRGGWDKFIFGADPKNLGVIISQVSIMQARVSQLDKQVSKMASSTDKTTVLANIQTLKDQITTLEQYVKDNINKFSLFGWMRGWRK